MPIESEPEPSRLRKRIWASIGSPTRCDRRSRLSSASWMRASLTAFEPCSDTTEATIDWVSSSFSDSSSLKPLRRS